MRTLIIMAVAYWVEQMSQNYKDADERLREKAVQAGLKDLMKHVFGRKPKASKFRL